MTRSDSARISVLDHGYVQLIESWGSDERIIESARMSTNKGFQGWGPKHLAGCKVFTPSNIDNFGKIEDTHSCDCDFVSGDEKLLSYLYSHKHMTPFEMCGLTLEIQAPIFVFREWHRHRTQSYNEMSARYTPLPDVNYLPGVLRCISQSQINKQASSVSGKVPSTSDVDKWLAHLSTLYTRAQDCYNHGLMIGIPKELARLCVPVARYSKMRASANLRNWLAFLTLRMDEAAQYEIRQYANVVGEIISQLFPRTWALFAGSEK